MKIAITATLSIDDGDLSWNFIRSAGPGGQNVNKVATAVQLRFNAAASEDLPDIVRQRLFKLAGKRLTREGEIVILARRYRKQERNREDALDRLITLIRKATETPQPRRKTRPSKAVKENRLKNKRRRSETKKMRKSVDNTDE